MSRIGTYGASQMYLSRIMATQTRLNTLQTQVATEKKSPNYTGIATDATRLINFENEMAQAAQYKKNNDMAATKLEAAQTSLDAVQDTIKQFSKMLDTFAKGNTTDPGKIKDLQEWAVRSMGEMEAYLNSNVDGQYVFAGGRVSTAPVQLTTTDLASFQSIYDGYLNTFPTTRAANLQDMHLSNAETGMLTFDANNGAIIPSSAGAFAKIATGSRLTVAGTTGNNKDVTVTGHVATNVNGKPLTETANAGANAFITFSGGNVLHGTTGDLGFSFNADGNMTITPGTANTLSNLTTGSRFTVKGSTDGDGDGFGDHDGAYVVLSNTNGVLTLGNDTKIAGNEAVDVSKLTLTRDTNADGLPETAAALGAITGDASFQVSGNTVTLTVPPGGTALNTLFAAGQSFTMAGSSDHDGSFKVASVGTNTMTFQINPDAVRTSNFVPQSGRTDVAISFPGLSKVLDDTAYGSLSFSPTGTGGETITAANFNAFQNGSGVNSPAAGEIITLKSTSGVNDGVYKVISNDGTNIVVESNSISSENSSTASLTSTAWYKGDTSAVEQRIDVGTSVDLSMYASDPAFEKALRAMGLIAQGVTGTAGGLDQNQSRIAAARYLIADAIEAPAAGTPPYGAELRGDMESLQSRIGVTQSVIDTRNTKHMQFMNLFETRANDLENVDKTRAVAMLLDEKNALEASYQTLATVRQLSLLNYMK